MQPNNIARGAASADTDHCMDGRRRLLEWLAEQLLIARLPVRIPPKARGISVIPPIFDGCGHS